MKKSKHILVCGGAGYIGAHMVWMLKDKGYKPVVFDNLSTGYREFVPEGVPFIKGDLKNETDIRKVFAKHQVDAVMHFAASSIVPESVENPLKYYENNVSAAINLIKVMIEFKVNKFIFSSSAAVYGEPKRVPIKETDPVNPKNPYGRSKFMIEQILEDCWKAYKLSYVILRYFNAGGSLPTGGVREKHVPETHLIPNILKVVRGEIKFLNVYGQDYPTKDGTCLRDYIHVIDICQAHFCALQILANGAMNNIFNLGSGSGYTVKEVIETVETVIGVKVNYRIVDRRPGDPSALIASSEKANKFLKWKPRYGLQDIVGTS